MKCPKCGFVSFPGLVHCKKCGHQFVSPSQSVAPAPPRAIIADLSVRLPSPGGGQGAPEPAPRDSNPPPSANVSAPGIQSLPSEPSAEVSAPVVALPIEATPAPAGDFAPRAVDRAAPPRAPSAPESARPWRDELAQRVQNFRLRRARLRRGFDPKTTLDLDFEKPSGDESNLQLRDMADSPLGERELDLDVGTPAGLESEMPVLDSLPLEKKGSDSRILNSAALEAGELALERGAVIREPLEILLESSAPSPEGADLELSIPFIQTASLGRRFFAGMLDAWVLLLGAGLFALIFWRAGGRISLQPANLWALAIVAVLFILLYFGLFTALVSCTPGLLWMGLEVRNLDGTSPTTTESFLRAFGYLVSITALMQGFIWALLDSDGLTWHDRMSGTFIAYRD